MDSLVKNWGSDRSGVSLIIAIIYVTLFMMVMTSLTQVQLATFDNLKNNRTKQQVEDLANAAAELGELWATYYSEGRNTTDYNYRTSPMLAPFYDALFAMATELGIPGCTYGRECFTFRVSGRDSMGSRGRPLVLGNDRYFSVPAPLFSYGSSGLPSAVIGGTGDAAAECGTDPEDANDACHWNKLYFGESAQIPLYYADVNGAPVKADFSSGNTDFKLRIRTPCADGTTTCTDAQRIELYPRVTDQVPNPYLYAYRDPRNDPLRDPVLVHWIMTDVADGRETMVANDEVNAAGSADAGHRPRTDGTGRLEVNTELSAGRINEANPSINVGGPPSLRLDDYIVLEKNQNGKVVATRRDQPIANFFSQPTIQRPVLKLSLLEHPRKFLSTDQQPTSMLFSGTEVNDRSRDVPYLEYQLLISGNEPVTNAHTRIDVSATVGRFKHEESRSYSKPAGLGGFALENL